MNIKTVFEATECSDKVPELIISFKRPKVARRPLETTEAQVQFLREIFDPNTFELQEELILLNMDDDFSPVCYYRLGKGLPDKVEISYQLILSILIVTQATNFITAHNHPNGVSLPSYSDVDSAHNMRIRCSHFGITCVDEIIISSLEEPEGDDPGYYSLADNGLFFESAFG